MRALIKKIWRIESYRFGRSNSFLVGDGTTVLVDDADEVPSSPSSSPSSSLSSKLSITGTSVGSLANCAFAKDL